MAPYEIQDVVRSIDPDSTVLLFGAGSSIPSGAPSSQKIAEHLTKTFQQNSDGFSLAEVSELVERKTGDRRALVSAVRELFRSVEPTRGILNIPRYDWKAIYTTNYDTLIEEAYGRHGVPLSVYDSNFDFRVRGNILTTKLYKLHGTINKDIVDGNNSRLVLTQGDYKHTQDYRDKLFDALKADLSEANIIIIGQSLADPDIKAIINRAIAINETDLSGTNRVRPSPRACVLSA